MCSIKDFSSVEEKIRYYGGNAGTKLSFTKENGENWFLKFSKTTRSMKNAKISYTTSPLSEYLGSNIYKILGYNVHETELGIYKNKFVVACKDFTDQNNLLYELKAIVNNNLGNEEEKIREKFSNDSNYCYDIEELKFVFEKNKIFQNNPKFIDYFFDMLIVDSYINNNDRHLDNIGFLANQEGTTIKLAPIYDNGNSFFTKYNENSLENILKNANVLNSIINNNSIPYILKNKELDSIKIIKKLTFGKDDKNKAILPEFDKKLKEALLRVVPKIIENRDKIDEFIKSIPEKYNEIPIMNKKQKELYSFLLKERMDKILIPSLNNVQNQEQSKGWGARVGKDNKFDITD